MHSASQKALTKKNPTEKTYWWPYLNPNLSLEDLSDIMPDVASSLREVLDYNGNVAEDLVLTFQVSFEEYGKVHTADLTAGNLDTPEIKQQLSEIGTT